MTKYVVLVIVTALTTGLLIWEFFPHNIVENVEIPKIVTKYDTVETLPDWWQDSVKKWKSRKVTTEKTPIVITNTIVAAAPIEVIASPEYRPDIWPLLDYHGGSKWGDTAIVRTFSLRDGRQALSKVFVPGILTGIEMDSSKSVPKLNYTPFPKPKKPSFLYRIKLIGIGGGLVYILTKVF